MFTSALNESPANSRPRKRMKLAKSKAYGKKAAGMSSMKKAKAVGGKKPTVKSVSYPMKPAKKR